MVDRTIIGMDGTDVGVQVLPDIRNISVLIVILI